MLSSILVLLALPASIIAQSPSPSPPNFFGNDPTITSPPIVTPAPTTTLPASTLVPPWFGPLASQAEELFGDYFHMDLIKRQGAPVTQAPAAVPTVVTQMGSITTYSIYTYVAGAAQIVDIPFTQAFAAVPDQWSSPAAGTIGLGTIAGQIGVVKSSKRDVGPEPTLTAGQILRIKGREVTIS